MKVLVIGNEDRYRKYMPEDIPAARNAEMVFVKRGAPDEEILEKGRDCVFLAADPMGTVSAAVIRGMEKLRLVHSEGVGFNGIDLEAARERGIPVCNCKGVNAGAVAEQTVFLMLALLRSAVTGDRAVRSGNQMETKEKMMLGGIRELSECSVGLIGLGDIGSAVAERLRPFGPKLYYWSRNRRDADTETRLGVEFLPMEELLSRCDILSLHTAVTPETRNMADSAFFSRLRPGALLINTARGELVDNAALIEALAAGKLAGAGLDTVYPEPVTADNPLLNIPAELADKLIFSPHIGGITTASFRRAHRMIWQSFQDVLDGKRPKNIVNGL